jgi:hypothetical protein
LNKEMKASAVICSGTYRLLRYVPYVWKNVERTPESWSTNVPVGKTRERKRNAAITKRPGQKNEQMFDSATTRHLRILKKKKIRCCRGSCSNVSASKTTIEKRRTGLLWDQLVAMYLERTITRSKTEKSRWSSRRKASGNWIAQHAVWHDVWRILKGEKVQRLKKLLKASPRKFSCF